MLRNGLRGAANRPSSQVKVIMRGETITQSLIIGSNFENICSDTFTVTKQGTYSSFPLLFSGFPDTQDFMRHQSTRSGFTF